MTGTEWKVGELPEGYEPGQVEVHPVPEPVARVIPDEGQRQGDHPAEGRASI